MLLGFVTRAFVWRPPAIRSRWVAAAWALVAVVSICDTALAANPNRTLSLGRHHACAVWPSGGLRCWGENTLGQVGNGGTTNQLWAVKVVGLSKGVVEVRTGEFHTCALTDAGAVKCWGKNASGQLGNGTTTTDPTTTPQQVSGLASGVVGIAAGGSHNCALLADETVRCWGANSEGQLGNGATEPSSTPVTVSGLSGVTALSLGLNHSCALTTAGAMHCWGAGTAHQLGNGASVNSTTPVTPTGLGGGVAAIATGTAHSCAVLTSGAGGGAKCWGTGWNGELGTGSGAASNSPLSVSGLGTESIDIRAGTAHTCVRVSTAEVASKLRCWGHNYNGEIGNGESGSAQTSPATVTAVSEAPVEFSPGHQFACVRRASAISCWGQDTNGKRGDSYAWYDVKIASDVVFNNEAPDADDMAVEVLEDGTLNGTLSGADIDGDALTYSLQSTTSNGALTLNDATTGSFTYVPSQDYFGTDSFTYRVTAGGVNSNTATVTITVLPVNDKPVAQDQTISTSPGQARNGTFAATDVEGDTLSFSVFAQGTKGTAVVTDAAAGTFTYTANAEVSGTDSFTFRAHDGTDYSDSATVSVTINTPPVFTGTPSIGGTGLAGQTLSAANTATSDADGDAVTLSYQWRADGVDIGGATSSTYTVAAGDRDKAITLVVTASDGTDQTSATTAAVTIGNTAPVGQTDSYTAIEGQVLDVPTPGVLGNDSDVDGDAITAVLVSGPAHGALALAADGGLTYTPDNGYVGIDGFSYKVSDGTAESPVVSVAIQIDPANRAPVANPMHFGVDEDQLLEGQLDATDPDGDALTYVITSQPASGRLGVQDEATGAFTYQPLPDFHGADSFSYRVYDGRVYSSVATVRIDVYPVNDEPVARGDEFLVEENKLLSVPAPGVLGNDYDADGDTLILSVVALPEHGILQLDGDGAFTYMPRTDYRGSDRFGYSICDGAGACAEARVSLTIQGNNRRPIVGDDGYATEQDATLLVEAPGVLSNDSDPENDRLVVFLREYSGSGRLELQGNGAFSYTPAPGFVGDESFTYRACDLSSMCAEGTVVIAVHAANAYVLPLLPPASNLHQQGFVRATNRSDVAGRVTVRGIDSKGRPSPGTVEFELGPGESRQFNSQDLERGNIAKHSNGEMGSGQGDWTLSITSDLDLRLMSLVRTPRGFLTSIHDEVAGDGRNLFVPIFNPAENVNQVSLLRLINPNASSVDIEIRATDDAGLPAPDGTVRLRLAPKASAELTAADLEAGNEGKGLAGRLGDGTGKWSLNVQASQAIRIQSLLEDPNGYLTNLSTAVNDQARTADAGSSARRLWFLSSADNEQQQGFVRIVNRSAASGRVIIRGIDDAGRPSPGSFEFWLGPYESKHFNSQDIERGNPAKGALGALGDGHGNWLLEVESELDLTLLSLIRTPHGFLTSMHDRVPGEGVDIEVPIFNPAENINQVSVLRVVNPNDEAVGLEIRGVDDDGLPGPDGAVHLQLAGRAAIELSAHDLEVGNAGKGLVGRLGDGAGKWTLTVSATAPVVLQNQLYDPQGYLTNLSTVPVTRSRQADSR